MQIIQLLPSITKGDAVSNNAFQMDKVLRKAGYLTHLYADAIGKGIDKTMVDGIDRLPSIHKQDILLYHLSIGSSLHEKIATMECRKIFVYHNITPAKFFQGCNPYLEQKCRHGLEEIWQMRTVPDACLAVSNYNKHHLEKMGYQCPIDVLPILFPTEEYARIPSPNVLAKYGNKEYTNVLFTGRITPNKKQDDIIADFYVYHKDCNPKSRLILVGNDAGTENYSRELKHYVRNLGLTEEDVVFAGHVSFEDMLAYYHVADIFLCMSEHEGFCIPLLEAMFFHIPIIAYDAGAVAETLNGSGILLKDKDPRLVAQIIDVLMHREDLRQDIVKKQIERLQDFTYEKVADKFLNYIRQYT